MKNSIYFLLFTLLLACSSEKESFLIGNITSYDPNSVVKQVYLFELGNQGFQAIDTAFIQENGVFKFKLNPLKSDLYTVGTVINNAILFYVDSQKSNLNLTINTNDRWSKGYDIKGNTESIKIAEFTGVVNEKIALGSTFNNRSIAIDFNDTLAQSNLRKEFEAELEIFNDKRDLFIKENINSPAIVAVMDQINPNEEMDLLKQVIYDGLGKSIPNSKFYINASEYIKNFEREKAEKERLVNLLKPGTAAPELNFPGVNGELVSLQALKGKVVLVDFWASWCRPCRAENPNVVRLYNKYKNAGFEVYSFSLDKDKELWVNAINQDGLIWKNHSSDLMQWQTAAIPLYGFNSIPFTVLVDKEGNVIDKNLRGNTLENKLKEIFGF